MSTTRNIICGLRQAGLLLLAALLITPLAASPKGTNEIAAEAMTNANEALRSYLVLQDQLRATQLALEQNRKESEALAARNTEAMEAKLKALETAMNNQRSAELNSMQETVRSNNRLMLMVSGSIAGVGFFVLLVTGYLQWRSVNRLAEVSAQVQGNRMALPAPASPAANQLLGAGQTSEANERLFGALSQLEKRILELEHSAHPAAAAKALTATTATATSNGHDLVIHETIPAAADGTLLAKGQALLDAEKPAEALACFEELLRAEPNHGEALVKKGLALEALQRNGEALACYDQAIAAHADLTIAYLQKGGLLNRLERYEEALQCYELALHAQEKVHAA